MTTPAKGEDFQFATTEEDAAASAGITAASAPQLADVEDPTEVIELPECCICLTEIEGEFYTCSASQQQHCLCRECGEKHLRTALERQGAFDSIQYQGGNENSEIRSENCQIPCPVFLVPQNPCDCAGLSFSVIVKILSASEDLPEKYEQAVRRFIEASGRRENSQADNDGDDEMPTGGHMTIERVYARVQQAMLKGNIMLCPKCKTPGIKDHACMHIVCRSPGCRAKWCYCCERHRGRDSPGDCRGCDAISPYLQNQPGWKALPRHKGESAGEAACNEFHRQRIRYFLQRIKHETPVTVWKAFCRAHPDILSNVPTQGRSIGWDELDRKEAARPPVFGDTVEADLLWKFPPPVSGHGMQNKTHFQTQSAIFNRDVEMGINNVPEQSNGAHPIPMANLELPPFSALITCEQGRKWLACVGLTLFLLVIRWAVADSPAFKTVTDTLVALVCYGGFSTVLLHMADNQAIHRDSILRQVADRQFLGRPNDRECPYLSRLGRWSSYRNAYVRFVVGGLALGSLLVGQASIMRSIEDPARGIGTGLVTLVATCWVWLTLLVNLTPKPANPNSYVCFRRLVQVLFIWSSFWSVGLGLTVAGRFVSMGKFLLSVGVGGLFAELSHRVGPLRIFWEPAEFIPMMRAYIISMGITLGSVLVHIGKNYDSNLARAGGITLLVLTSVMGCYLIVAN